MRGGSGMTPALLELLFDRLPETAFFVKDVNGRYIAVNESLVERCGMRAKRELLGKHVREIFPTPLAERYESQDRSVLSTGRPILDRLELHWYARCRQDWCLTTKLPIQDQQGKVIGLIGISRDVRAPGDRTEIPASLLPALEQLSEDLEQSPASLARIAGLSPVRFARLIRRIFRLTPTQLITQARLGKASELLESGSLAIIQIANTCGFSDQSAFTRAFRSATGFTPAQYRKQRLRAAINE